MSHVSPGTGRIADRYLIEEEIGSGAMGTVYLARDIRHDRLVALKVLHPDRTAGIDAERFIAEIRTVARLTHPHIVPVHDSGDHDGTLWYVMPRVEGESLRQRVDRNGPMAVNEAVSIAAQVADALGYAHARGVIHRDIKPGNILLDGSGHAWLADFGLARALTERVSSRRTAPGLTVGSPLYMSPEQAVGDVDIDARSDIYSLGCAIFEMLAAAPPFDDDDARRVLQRRITEDAPSIRERRADVPAALDDVLRTALARDPDDRFSSAAQLRDAITAATLAAAPPPVPEPEPRRAPDPGRLVSMVGAFAVALILVLGTVYMFRGSGVPAGLDEERLAVFPFRAIGPEIGAWAEGAPDLLTTVLDGAEGVRVADPWALWRPLRAERSAAPVAPDPTTAAELAMGARAYRYLLGSIVEDGDSVRLSLRVYRVGRDEPIHVLSASGVPGDLAGAVRSAAVSVIAHIATEEGSALPGDLVLDPTDSPEALKAYLAAREAMRRGLVDSAGIAIDRAVALDSTFALALLEAVHVKSWAAGLEGRPYQGLLRLLDLVEPYVDSLNPRTRLRVDATRASVMTDGAAAAAAAREILRLDSTDIQAWAGLTYFRTAYGWQFGATAQQAADAADHVVALDSTYVPGLVARAALALALQDSAASRRQLQRLLAADTSAPLARSSIVALRAAVADETAFGEMLPRLASAEPAIVPMLLVRLTSASPRRAYRVISALLEHEDAAIRDVARGELARMLVAVGSPGRADSIARLPALRGNRRDFALHGLIVAAAINGLAPADLGASSAREIAALIPIDSVDEYWNSRPVWVGGWLLGAFGATLGDTADARRWQMVFDTMPEGGSPTRWAAAIAADIEARIAARGGDARRALDAARRAYDDWYIHSDATLEYLPEPSMRLHLATLYRDAGMPDSARGLVESLTPPSTSLGFLTPRAHFELGEILLATGESAAAGREFRRALEFWEQGGTAIAEWREQAQRAVAGEPRPPDRGPGSP